MQETILLTPRAQQKEWQEVLPALEQIPLQPMEDTMTEQVDPCNL